MRPVSAVGVDGEAVVALAPTKLVVEPEYLALFISILPSWRILL